MNNDKTFATIVRSNSNSFIYDVMRQLARCGTDSASIFSPFYLFGEAGTGKSHLLKAFYTDFLIYHPDACAVYVTAKDITYHLFECYHTDRMGHFQDRYTFADLLIIDDFEQLYSKPATQFLVFQLIREVVQRNRVVILASTKPPSDIIEAESLLALLESGVTIGTSLPDLKIKMVMVRQVAEDMQFMLSEDELQQIAESCATYVDIEQMIQAKWGMSKKEQGDTDV